MPAANSEVCVFSPSLFLTVTIEALADNDDGDDIHFHPGGQGFWIARMLHHLGATPVIVAPVGGESGEVLRGLLATWDLTLDAVAINDSSPAYVHDRRDGERRELGTSLLPAFNRHEIDTLYGRVLECAVRAGTCIVTGKHPGDHLPVDFYERLGADLATTNVDVIGDLHGAELAAFLRGGPLHTLKVSDSDFVEDGELAEGASVSARFEAIERYSPKKVSRLVISADKMPTVAQFETRRFTAEAPMLESVDHRGSGDSMTAGLALAVLRGLDAIAALQLACGAGAANVTRHGLGNADAGLVESLAKQVKVEEVEGMARA
ncbi:MAG: PfkB family carbohydrate kinase [Phycisphaerae bacterium]